MERGWEGGCSAMFSPFLGNLALPIFLTESQFVSTLLFSLFLNTLTYYVRMYIHTYTHRNPHLPEKFITALPPNRTSSASGEVEDEEEFKECPQELNP